MILEALIAGDGIEIDGHPLHPDFILSSLPVPLLREHKGKPIGEVYQLVRISKGLIALIETDTPCAEYTHVSPSLRLMPGGTMKLVEVSLVRRSVSPQTIILSRRTGDPLRDYARLRSEGADLMIKRISLLQKLVRIIHDTYS